jgi:hypothetical protein
MAHHVSQGWSVLVVGLVVALLLTGCTRYWVKPGASTSDFNRDTYVCQQEARYGSNIYGALIDPGLYDSCMRARGWEIRAQ